jgi:hypothetical protein
MEAAELEKARRKFLRSSGKPLSGVSAADVLRLSTEHWASTQVNGLRLDQGDGLVAYFEFLDRGRGVMFEFGVSEPVAT